MKSTVEAKARQKSCQEAILRPVERIPLVIVDQFPELGKLTALRFIEWAQQNPEGCISLPTGKTPEHFIKWTQHILTHWESKDIRSLLEQYGIDPGRRPDLHKLHFVQIDEFYPMDSNQHNSFNYYVRKFYIDGFGLDPEKALLIDPNVIGIPEGKRLKDVWPEGRVNLELRYRRPRSIQEQIQQATLFAVDQFCDVYEERIRELGGIGFFLGGIGPDGHIAFNIKGSSHFSTTRLIQTNYETQAAAAGDLGGIETARNSLAITIGLKTITWNPEVVAIIMAAGEAKAKIVRKAIEQPASIETPASVLHQLEHACFYLTKGAAKTLTARRDLALDQSKPWTRPQLVSQLHRLSIDTSRALEACSEEALTQCTEGQRILSAVPNFEANRSELIQELKQTINDSLQPVQNEVVLHTAPHHDDIMLGYLPYLNQFINDASNRHHFLYLTSGFNAVTNAFMLERCDLGEAYCGNVLEESGPDDDIQDYLEGLASNDEERCRTATARRFLRNLKEVFPDETLTSTIQSVRDYLQSCFPGQKDSLEIQKLKGMQREWEADLVWGHYGFGQKDVTHARLGFYKGDLFTEEPEVDRDVLPVYELLKTLKPTIVTVAFDPEGSGPDTHYKVMQAIATALKMYHEETGNQVTVWGYRNVWYRFGTDEANLMAPVLLSDMNSMEDIFLNSFASQAQASFPSYELDGHFSQLAKNIQADQAQKLQLLLGDKFFKQHADPRVNGAKGFVFLKTMDLKTFLAHTRALKSATE